MNRTQWEMEQDMEEAAREKFPAWTPYNATQSDESKIVSSSFVIEVVPISTKTEETVKKLDL